LTIETCAGHRDYQSEKNVADRSNFNKCVWHLICFNCSYCCKIREMIMRSNFMGSKLPFFMRSKVLQNWSWDRNWHFSGDRNPWLFITPLKLFQQLHGTIQLRLQAKFRLKSFKFCCFFRRCQIYLRTLLSVCDVTTDLCLAVLLFQVKLEWIALAHPYG
jgi:hypothetical protein